MSVYAVTVAPRRSRHRELRGRMIEHDALTLRDKLPRVGVARKLQEA